MTRNRRRFDVQHDAFADRIAGKQLTRANPDAPTQLTRDEHVLRPRRSNGTGDGTLVAGRDERSDD